ncbi:MAG: hypothetical protein ABFS34_16885 [Gemmatimonadota bacterium]
MVVTLFAALSSMANPRRFFGADHEIHIGDVIIPPRCAVEVTFRTHQQRFQLRPDKEASELILGCLGRAYHRYPELNLNVVSVLSNHGCFVACPDSAYVLSSFMRDFLSTAAKRLNGHRDRDGTFWERRYRAIPILDEEALDERFRYVLTQGTKENLVWSARQWPGIGSIDPLLGGQPLVGRWRDRVAEGELRRRQRRKLERAAARGTSLQLPKAPQVWLEYPIELVPLPHWQRLKVGQRRARVAEMLREDDCATRMRHERDGTEPLGVRAILATDPFDRPRQSARSPAPPCHTRSRKLRRAFRAVCRTFDEMLASGRDAVEAFLPQAGVPLDVTLPPLSHRKPMSPRRPPPTPVVCDREHPLANAIGPPGHA